MLLSRARVAPITFGHAPTLCGSNWNDIPGMLGAFRETGGLFTLAQGEYWLPATPGDLQADERYSIIGMLNSTTEKQHI